jgi:predicted nicotinamide N-methyase
MARDRTGDPNFPEGGLAITPSYAKYAVNAGKSDNEWQRDTQEDIEDFGIAGRVWEASYLLTRYLSSLDDENAILFDPACSLFNKSTAKEHTVIELGAGVGVAGIHLALEMTKRAALEAKEGEIYSSSSQVILTDLENVLPLLSRNVKRANLGNTTSSSGAVKVDVRQLAWGSTEHADEIEKEVQPRTISHIVCSDLVYFPELLAPLLQTLIYLTRSPETVEVIIGYKVRSYSKEEAFWKAFGVWFDFAPVICRNKDTSDWRRFGSKAVDFDQPHRGSDEKSKDEEADAEDEMFVFVAQRKESTLDCRAPPDDEHLLGGWLLRQGRLEQGSGAETFELILLNSIQD